VRGAHLETFIQSLASTTPISKAESVTLPPGKTIQSHFKSEPITEVTILICGHKERDVRCGVMGPLLQLEFEDKLRQSGIIVRRDPISLNKIDGSGDTHENDLNLSSRSARIGLISHIGGHAFAGNVIIYVPSSEAFISHPLSGTGVWYGRVQPQHVEGIVRKTVMEGVIIQELLRGVI
jgi:hypothetical protein